MPIFERVRRLFTRSPEKRIRELAKQLQDKDENVRYLAVRELGKTKHPAAIPHLAKTLQKDWHPDVRNATAEALGNTALPEAILPLTQVLLDHDGTVRSNATLALGRIGRKIQRQKVEGKEAKAAQLIGKYIRPTEELGLVRKAYWAAFEGKITEQNARLYIKQLRALRGKVK